jgi:hypothetical protein
VCRDIWEQGLLLPRRETRLGDMTRPWLLAALVAACLHAAAGAHAWHHACMFRGAAALPGAGWQPMRTTHQRVMRSACTQPAWGCSGSGAGGLQNGGRRLTQAGSGGFPEKPHSTHAPVTAAAFTKAASEASTGSSLQAALLAAATRLTQRSAVAVATAAPAAGAAVGSGQGAGFWGANAAGSGGRGGGGPGGFPGGPGAGFNRSAGSSNGTGHAWDGDGLNSTRHGAFNGSAWGGPNGTHNGTWGSFGGGNGMWNGTHGSFNGSSWGANGTWNGTYAGDRGGRPDGRFGRGGDRDGDRRFRRGPPGNGTGAPGNGTDTPTPAPSDTPTTAPVTTDAGFVTVEPVGGLRRLLAHGAFARPPAEAASEGRLPSSPPAFGSTDRDHCVLLALAVDMRCMRAPLVRLPVSSIHADGVPVTGTC